MPEETRAKREEKGAVMTMAHRSPATEKQRGEATRERWNASRREKEARKRARVSLLSTPAKTPLELWQEEVKEPAKRRKIERKEKEHLIALRQETLNAPGGAKDEMLEALPFLRDQGFDVRATGSTSLMLCPGAPSSWVSEETLRLLGKAPQQDEHGEEDWLISQLLSLPEEPGHAGAQLGDEAGEAEGQQQQQEEEQTQPSLPQGAEGSERTRCMRHFRNSGEHPEILAHNERHRVHLMREYPRLLLETPPWSPCRDACFCVCFGIAARRILHMREKVQHYSKTVLGVANLESMLVMLHFAGLDEAGTIMRERFLLYAAVQWRPFVCRFAEFCERARGEGGPRLGDRQWRHLKLEYRFGGIPVVKLLSLWVALRQMLYTRGIHCWRLQGCRLILEGPELATWAPDEVRE